MKKTLVKPGFDDSHAFETMGIAPNNWPLSEEVPPKKACKTIK